MSVRLNCVRCQSTKLAQHVGITFPPITGEDRQRRDALTLCRRCTAELSKEWAPA